MSFFTTCPSLQHVLHYNVSFITTCPSFWSPHQYNMVIILSFKFFFMHKTTYWEKYNSFKKIVHFFFSLNTWFSCHCVTNIIEAFWFGLHLTSSFTLADENLHIVCITRNEVRKSVSLPTIEMYGNPQYNCCFFFSLLGRWGCLCGDLWLP